MDSAPVALVTAGSAGLGAATARVFASEGMRVVINYSANKDRAAKLAEELSAFSPNNGKQAQAAHIRADLGKRADIVRLVDETIAVFGRLDVVFSNGGWTRLFLMHAAKKHLEKTKGVFITTASLAGVSVSGSSLAYSVTKAAQIHLVKGLANAAGPNIRVNSVSPGCGR